MNIYDIRSIKIVEMNRKSQENQGGTYKYNNIAIAKCPRLFNLVLN